MELLFILIVHQLFDLKKQRHQLYLDACDAHLINNDTIENIIDKIMELIKK